jgi:hypothetical protein
VLKDAPGAGPLRTRTRFGCVVGVAAVLLVLGVGPGCGGAAAPAALAPTGLEPPGWVSSGDGAFIDEGRRTLHGVGRTQLVQEETYSHVVADNRARTAVTKVAKVYLALLVRGYEPPARQEDTSVEYETVPDVIGLLVRGARIEIHDHWTDVRDGTVYSLAVLEVAALVARAGEIPEVSAGAKEYMRLHADRAHAELAEQGLP